MINKATTLTLVHKNLGPQNQKSNFYYSEIKRPLDKVSIGLLPETM